MIYTSGITVFIPYRDLARGNVFTRLVCGPSSRAAELKPRIEIPSPPSPSITHTNTQRSSSLSTTNQQASREKTEKT